MTSFRSVAAIALLCIAGCRTSPQPQVPVPAKPPEPQLRYEATEWNALPGWQQDRLIEAWPALLGSCRTNRMAEAWRGFCTEAAAVAPQNAAAQRALIEARLRPHQIISVEGLPARRIDSGLITGYYEPFLNGARRRSGAFQTPLYAVPEDLVTVDLGEVYPELQGARVRGRLQGKRVVPYPDRSQLADGRVLAGREILWVDSPIDAFFLQIQGSGRVRLQDGSTVRLAFADVNGRPYRAIGRYLVERGEMTVDQATAPALREWLKQHPERQQEVFNQNPSVVFFREEKIADPSQGPRGSLGVPLTPGRSVAIDPRWLPQGSPLFLATTDPLTALPLQRMVVAQDTGGAIRGAIRADLFWGWAETAADAAGRMRAPGSMWLLWPQGQSLPAIGPAAAN